MSFLGLSRRSLLGWLGWGIALVPFLPLRRALARDVAPHPLGRHFHDRATVDMLGATYLERRPTEADPERLRALLGLPQEPLVGRPRKQTRRLLITALEHQRADFRDGNVLVLHGWVMTVSELRLFALIHLESGREEHR